MEREVYTAAQTVAPKVLAYFQHQRTLALARGQDQLASLPAQDIVEKLIDSAFWASLRREEGYTPLISLAWLPPVHAACSLLLTRPLPLTPAALTRIAPAVERAGIHLGVWHTDGLPFVWGTTRSIPRLCFVLEVAAPGLLVIKHHDGDELGKFANVAVLQGDQIKLMDELSPPVPQHPSVLTSLLGSASLFDWAHSANVLAKLSVSMRAHGRGGCFLVVPTGTSTWSESIIHPMSYAVTPPFSVLSRLSQADSEQKASRAWHDELLRTIEWIGGLSAVDGAVVLTDRYDMLGFGAKITLRRGSEHIAEVAVSEPVLGATTYVGHPEQLGGTRHLSAAQFVHDQQDAAAFVASQDGRFTILEWCRREHRVHAHRVEALLL